MNTLDNIKSILIDEKERLISGLSSAVRHEEATLKRDIEELDAALYIIKSGINLSVSDCSFIAAHIKRGQGRGLPH